MKLNAYEKTFLDGIGIGASPMVFSGHGILRSITVGTTAAGAINIVDGNVRKGQLKTSIVENTYFFDLVIGSGLTIGLAASPKITVMWEK